MKKEKSIIRRMAIESFKRKKATKRQFYFSVISLFIAMAIFVTGTFSWFSIRTAKLNAKTYKLECGKGLRVNDSGTSDFQYKPLKDYILPASSVDGRNLFFPTDGTDFSMETKEITYRSANVGDKNVNYAQIDFTLTASENNTALYIDDREEKTFMTVTPANGNPSSALAAPLRFAIWAGTEDDNEAPNPPVVFNPTGTTFYTAAVSSVDRASGKLLNTERQISHAYYDYAYGGKPVAVLSKGVKTKLSIVIWLEGADPKSRKLGTNSNSSINFGIAFTTSWDKTQAIRFKDKSSSTWVKNLLNQQNSPYELYLHYNNTKNTDTTDDDEATDFLMYKYHDVDDPDEWMCNIPGDMKNEVTFQIRNKTTGDVEYEFERDSNNHSTKNRELNRLYEVDSTSTSSSVSGHWVALGDSDGGGTDIHDLEGDDF